MNKSTKIGLIVVSVLLIGAGVAYVSTRKKKPGDESSPEQGGNSSPETSSGTKPSTSTSSSPKKPSGKKPQQVASINTGVQTIRLVKTDDVLSTNINGAVGKLIYATADGVGIYNMNNQKVGSTKKNQLLGALAQARPDNSGSYIVNFVTADKVKYWIVGKHTALKV